MSTAPLRFVAAGTRGGQVCLADSSPLLRPYGSGQLAALGQELFLVDARGAPVRPVVSAEGGRCVVRYRDDAVGRPQALTGRARGFLRGLADVRRSARWLELRPGEGYLIHNHRMLHGRSAFSGERWGARLLASVHPDSPYHWLNQGFRVPGASRAEGGAA